MGIQRRMFDDLTPERDTVYACAITYFALLDSAGQDAERSSGSGARILNS